MSNKDLDEEITNALRGVMDPELKSDIVTLGMLKEARRSGKNAYITIALTTSGCPLRHQIKTDIERKVSMLPEVEQVKTTFSELNPEEKRTLMDVARKKARENAAPIAIGGSTRVIAIASGKGGVGKSSLTANLAASIANQGFSVGVLDADIWGFSQPDMLGVNGRLSGRNGKITPHVRKVGNGLLKVVSMGFLVDDNQSALMWRGPILAKAVEQFLTDVAWGDLQYLLVDMPPGTGDIQMAIARLVPQSEMLIVTTPASGAHQVAARVGDMARRSYMPILGVVENMSFYIDESGNSHNIFGEGGGQKLAQRLKSKLLAQIPIDANVSEANAIGEPIALRSESSAAEALRTLAIKITNDLCPPIEMTSCTARILQDLKQASQSQTPSVVTVTE